MFSLFIKILTYNGSLNNHTFTTLKTGSMYSLSNRIKTIILDNHLREK